MDFSGLSIRLTISELILYGISNEHNRMLSVIAKQRQQQQHLVKRCEQHTQPQKQNQQKRMIHVRYGQPDAKPSRFQCMIYYLVKCGIQL